MLGLSLFAVAAPALVGTPPAQPEKGADPLFAEYAAKSADNFLTWIDSGDVLPNMLLVGYTEAYGWVNGILDSEGKPMLYCVPPEFALRAEQAGSLLREYVKDHPGFGKYPASMLMFQAMRETFPCPEENR